MGVADLAFLLLVLATAVIAAVLLVHLARGRGRAAARWAAIAATIWAGYLLAGWTVALATPQRILPPGQERCFDEMCFRVASVQEKSRQWTVTVEAANRGRGRAQAENGAEAYLVDAAGHAYKPLRQSGPGLDTRVAAGDAATTDLVFALPQGVRPLGLVVAHVYRLNPGRIIIGDEEHFAHRPTLLALN